MERKKIFLVMPSLRSGGAEKTILTIAQGLPISTYDTHVVIFSDDGSLSVPPGVSVTCFGVHRARKALWLLAKLLRTEKPSIVVGANVQTTIVLGLIKILRLGGDFKLINRLEANLTLLLQGENLVTRPLFLMGLMLSDKIIAVSHALNDSLHEHKLLMGKTVTIYNPINIADIQERVAQKNPFGFNTGTKIIVGVGRLNPQKRFDTLIRAFAEVRRAIPNTKLVIVGEGDDRETLKQLAVSLGIHDDVLLVGFQENPYAYMGHADVFVLSSQWEGLGNVVIEALAAGVPVVATNCEFGPPEILEHGEYGTLVPVGDVTSLADGVKGALELSDTQKAAQVERGRERAKHFSLDRIIAQYEEIFNVVER